MDGPTAPRLRYIARLEGGPHHGTKVALRAGPSGGPPDFIYPDDEGVYALAGAADRGDRLPYWWMSWARAAALRQVLSKGDTFGGFER